MLLIKLLGTGKRLSSASEFMAVLSVWSVPGSGKT